MGRSQVCAAAAFGFSFIFLSYNRSEPFPYQRWKNSTPETSRKGMTHFQTSKEIRGVKHCHPHLIFTVTFLFWCGNCSSLLGTVTVSYKIMCFSFLYVGRKINRTKCDPNSTKTETCVLFTLLIRRIIRHNEVVEVWWSSGFCPCL